MSDIKNDATGMDSAVKSDSATFVKKSVKDIVPAAAPEVPKNTESVIFIGDSISGLQQFSVFRNGVPEYLKAEIKKCPAIGELIIPISQLGQSRGQINIKGSREYLLNLLIKQYVRR